MSVFYKDYIKKVLNPTLYFTNDSVDFLGELFAKLVLEDSEKKADIFPMENGRSSLYLLIKSLGLEKGSKILVQPYTCNSAISPIIWNGLEPVYCDIELSILSMNPDLARAKIESDKSIKVIIIQHTFGIPSRCLQDIDYYRERGLYVIEDCAHLLGTEYSGKKLGTFGDCAIFSFGLEKVLPSKVGGVALVNNPNLRSSFLKEYSLLTRTSSYRSLLWILNPLLRYFSRKTGKIGRYMLDLLVRIGLFNVGFVTEEYVAKKPKYYPRKMSGVIASVLIDMLESIEELNQLRSSQVKIYSDSLIGKSFKRILNSDIGLYPLIKYPIKFNSVEGRMSARQALIARQVYVSDWYDAVIYPKETDLESYFYKKGSCPVAEEASDTVLALPTGDAFTERSMYLLNKI